MVKVYARESNISGIGIGLFATENIHNGDTIVEFTGKLLAPDEKTTNGRSNIGFDDGYVLQCDRDDMASYANDLIIYPNEKRGLLGNLLRKTPFYLKHPNAQINACIMHDNDEHRAFLVASRNISPNDEIYVHYGFMYWIRKEYFDVGFFDEKIISLAHMPIRLHQYDAFFEYVKIFYPNYASHKIVPFCENYDNIILYSDDGEYYYAFLIGVLNIRC